MQTRGKFLSGISLYALVFAGVCYVGSLPATADEAKTIENNSILDTVVVTSARDRKESLQQAPVAVTALTSKQLQSAHVDTLKDIAAMTPNLQMFHQAATGDVATIYLRGFGAATNDPSVDPPVAVYVDGIYQPAVNGTLIDMFDVAQVEVMRGPQGTLLGKNATVGAVSITTKRPTGELDGEAELDLGTYDRLGVKGRIDFPIVKDILAAKLTFMDEKGGNYDKNLITGQRDMGGVNKRAVRLGLLYTPSSRLSWYVTATGVFNRDPQDATRNGSTTQAFPPFAPFVPYACSLYGYCTPDAPHTTRAGQTTPNNINSVLVSSTLDYKLDPVTITAVNGFLDYSGVENHDIDGLPEVIVQQDNLALDYTENTQEIRISSNKNGGLDLNGKLNWVVGAFFYEEKFYQEFHLKALDLFCPGGCLAYSGQRGKSESQAVYAHMIYNITDALNVSVGARHTWDEKSHSYYLSIGAPYVADNPASWSHTSYEAGAQYKLSDDKMVYVRFAQGYRGGGFQGIPSSAATAGTYQPETNNTYEIGMKTDWLDKRLRVNADFFLGKYSNLQRTVYVPTTGVTGFAALTKNAATAKVQGVELEVTVEPVPALTMTASAGYLDAKYSNYMADVVGDGVIRDLSGMRFGFAPRFTGNFNVSYLFNLKQYGALTLSGDYNYRSSQYLYDVSIPSAYQPAYGLLNTSLRYDDPSGRYAVTVYGKNILGKNYLADAAPISLETVLVDGAPATWGITLNAHF
jgi:iron complex outermembrane receptor protein